MRGLRSVLGVLATAVIITSCGKENFAPEIALESSGPTTVVEFVDSIEIVLSFRDMDGDLGENYTDDKNLFVLDSRLGLYHTYRISSLVPGGASVPIQGELKFTIPSVFLSTAQLNEEKVHYTIHVIDRAGNESNRVETPQITITK